MRVQVRINEEGALRNQRYAFSDRFTLVSELLQNARRAGATRIDVDYDTTARVLRVKDDGRGLTDFQKLLSFHESGWDAATNAEEHPFGVGFSKCLYAATRCIVASRRQRVEIDTAAALEKADFEVAIVSEGQAMPGTLVELHGVDLPDLGSKIEILCAGFPVSVLFNGQPLARRFADGSVAMMSSQIGSVHLAGSRDGKHTRDTLVFLQGFCVMRPPHWPRDDVNIVHLDSRQFVARLPDRDKLIDEDMQRRRIDDELKACWGRTLKLAKTQLPAEQFVELYFDVMRHWGHLDLLNDIDVLPAKLFSDIVGYPIQDNFGRREYLRETSATPSRAAIEGGDVTLVDLDWVNGENVARWMLARAKGYLVIDLLGLHADHWARRRIRHLELEPASVEALSKQITTRLDGRWIWPEVTLCEAVRVRVGADWAEITDEGVFHDDHLYIPAGEASGEPVQQVSSFTDEHDQFLESDLDADRDALAELILRLRLVDPVQAMDSLLKEIQLGKYSLLHGRTFQVTAGVGASPGYSVELGE